MGGRPRALVLCCTRAGVSSARALLLLSASLAVPSCLATPGLEPPNEDSQVIVRGPSGSMTPPASQLPGSSAGMSGGDFGNSASAGSSGTTQPPGDVAPVTPPATAGAGAPTMGSAGNAAEAPQSPDSGATTSDGGSANPAFNGLDLDPKCANETVHPLVAGDACSFALPEGVDVDAALASIALVSNGQFTSVARVAGPYSCELLTGGFFFDEADPPTRITLCAQSCLQAGTAAEMQVVLVLSCEPPTP